MNLKEFTSANKMAWNEVMPKHQKVWKEELDTLFARPGYTVLTDKDVLGIFDKININGKDVIHLCCNNGVELMSIKNMGANRCVGIDISELAIDEASQRAKKCTIDCEFICSDVYEIPENLFNSFDVVLITVGCTGWMPDINLFFNICRKVLRPEGFFFIHEIHPFSEMLPFDNSDVENRLQIVDKYFHDGPIIENTSLDYIGGEQYKAKTQYWFVHTISNLVMALNNNGFKIIEFIESPCDFAAIHKKVEQLNALIPLSMIILGEKKRALENNN
jgi:2-polyprenyl-3-methyl-5-hydroxy-6-metoxy-1,4-benzoquinol methylase